MTFKEAMKEQRYNITTLAADLGVTRLTLHNWLTKKFKISYEYKVKIAKLLKTSIKEVERMIEEW